MVDASTDRDLAGALITIVETGEQARSDEKGKFRFQSVKSGSYTLDVSYLGFPPSQQTVVVQNGSTASALFALGQREQIIVYGSRSARATALNIQRSAENNSDVIAADDLGSFTGTTFSEALRRAPGISFQRNAVTGDGTNVVVRGLEPDMNAIKLNGLNLPVCNGLSRSADLSNLLADSVGKITIHKSLLPSQDSSGTGGLIEIETLTPLDRPRRYASLSVEGGLKPKDFADDFLASGTVSGRFGASENVGLSASVQYRKHSNRSIGYDVGGNGGSLQFGRALPLNANGQPLTQLEAVNPLLTFPFAEGDDQAYTNGLNTTYSHVATENLAATLSGEWAVGTHTNLKFSFQHSETTSDTFSLTDTFGTRAQYAVIPGEGPNAQLRLNLAPGNAGIIRSQSYTYDPNVKQVTDTYSFSGKSDFGPFELKYMAGYAHGAVTQPATLTQQFRSPDRDATATLFLPEAVDPRTGRILTGFAPRTGNGIPLPLLSNAGWALVNDPTNFTIQNASGQVDEVTGSNNRYTASTSIRWNANAGPLTYFELGGYYERARFRDDRMRSQIGGNIPASALGLSFTTSDLTRIGISFPGFTTLSEAAVREFAANLQQYASDGTGLTLTPIAPVEGQDQQNTLETTYAAYAPGTSRHRSAGDRRRRALQPHRVLGDQPQLPRLYRPDPAGERRRNWVRSDLPEPVHAARDRGSGVGRFSAARAVQLPRYR